MKKRVWDVYKKKYIPEEVYKIYPEPIDRATGRMIKDWEDYVEGESFYPENQEIRDN